MPTTISRTAADAPGPNRASLDLLPMVAEPLDGVLEPFLEGGVGLVADELLRPVNGGQQPAPGVPPFDKLV